MQKPLAIIIEDHEDQAMVFSTALQVSGYETETILDGAVAQQRLKEIIPTLIILDLHLPYVSGDEILKQVRAEPRLSDVRVIIATADALMGESLRGLADHVLLKPISFIQLKTLIQRIAEQGDSTAD
ncbi:MAG: response regulator [Chloroflexota bacterium]